MAADSDVPSLSSAPESSSSESPAPDSNDEASEGGGRSARRWVVGAVLLVFFSFIVYQVINPYRDQPFEEVPHGDHVHYLPKDRNPDIPLNQFPTTEPGPNERITPEGQIVRMNAENGE